MHGSRIGTPYMSFEGPSRTQEIIEVSFNHTGGLISHDEISQKLMSIYRI